MRGAFSFLLVLICFFLVDARSARARVVEEVQYTFFVAVEGNQTASAQFFVRTFVTNDITILSKQLESCQFEGLPCQDVTLLPDFTEDALGGKSFDVFEIAPPGPRPTRLRFPTRLVPVFRLQLRYFRVGVSHRRADPCDGS